MEITEIFNVDRQTPLKSWSIPKGAQSNLRLFYAPFNYFIFIETVICLRFGESCKQVMSNEKSRVCFNHPS